MRKDNGEGFCLFRFVLKFCSAVGQRNVVVKGHLGGQGNF